MIDPFPSPYVSDWEANPHMGSLTVFNETGAEGHVRLRIGITDGRNSVLAQGTSDPLTLPPGASTFDSPFDLSGEFSYDVGRQDVIVRTGRLPEGDYTACALVTDLSGFVLAEDCVSFSVMYPDPPMLLSPFDGERVMEEDPVFEWTPLQVPFDYPVRFVLQVARILPGQSPQQALRSGIPHYLDSDLASTSVQYPLGALPFEAGGRYAWRVQALDHNGYPASANNGSSEIWTFVYGEGTDRLARVRIAPSADTLAFPGDTTRLVARAYDEDGFELPGRAFDWVSSDTSVARVDSMGVVTGAGAGEARILARLEDAADSVSVVTRGGGSGVRIAFFDPETETPELYALLETGSWEEIADRLQELLSRGEFALPLPASGGAASGSGSAGGAGSGAMLASADPAAAFSAASPNRGGAPASALCSGFELPHYVHRDDDTRSFAIGMRPPVDAAASLFRCLGLSDWWADRPGQKLEVLFLVTLPEQGAAQASIGLKLPFVGLLENQPGVHMDYAVLVLNFWRGFEMNAARVFPGAREVRDFYPHRFMVTGLDTERKWEVGGERGARTTGIGALNFYGRLDLSRTPVVDLLDVLGYQDHAIELQAALSFSRAGGLGAIVREEATGARPDTLRTGLTFQVEGRLPRRVPQAGNLSEYIRWAQAGIALEVDVADTRAGGSGTDGASGAGGSGTDGATGAAGAPAGGTRKTTVTPRLTHTMELALPFPNWPALTLRGSAGWAGIHESGSAGAGADGSAVGADGGAADSASDGGDGTTPPSRWVLNYQVASGGEAEDDDTIVLWDFLHLKLGAQIAYSRSTAATPSQWEITLSGTGGFGSAEEAAKVSVSYGRESADCGGPDQPPCRQPGETETGQPQPPGLTPGQTGGRWKMTLESKGVAFGALLKDARRLFQELRD